MGELKSREPLSPALLFRVDASGSVGAGHLVRCLSIAKELRARRFECVFDSPRTSEPYLSWIRADEHEVLREVFAANSPSEPFSWAIADDYTLGDQWIQDAARAGSKTLVIDDLANRPLRANIIVNPNPWAQAADYATLAAPHTRLLLGTRFAPVRRAFLHAPWRGSNRNGSIQRVLVSMGGGSAGGVTSTVMRGIRAELPSARVDVVLGAAESVGEAFGANVTVHTSLGAAALAELMIEADVAVGGAGTMSWERCAIGIPSIVVALAANQLPVARCLSTAGAAIYAGTAEEATIDDVAASARRLAAEPELRAQMSDRARSLVDGQGAVRIANVVDGVRMRRATPADSNLLWIWANDPATRANSIATGLISWEDHVDWLNRKLRDPATILLIGENGLGPVGQVRFDLQPECEVSISVAPEHRGQLLGDLMLQSSMNLVADRNAVHTVLARVRSENLASRRLFEGAGFSLRDEEGSITTYERRLSPR